MLMLGHTSISTTERYAKSSVQHIKECVEGARTSRAQGNVIEFKGKN